MNSLTQKKLKKDSKKEREHKVLLGLVELYIRTGEPVGSNTLRNNGFQSLSSATLRNYFATLEKAGFLIQQHTSGGRVPTDKAFKEYAASCIHHPIPCDDTITNEIDELAMEKSKEVSTLLHSATDLLGQVTKCAAFSSSPRFDHDFVRKVTFVTVDSSRYLCVIVTDFGLIQTHILYTDKELSPSTLSKFDEYFHLRLSQSGKPGNISQEELRLAQRFYNEVMVRYMIHYSNFSHADIYQSGLSHLLSYPEFDNAKSLANSLSLFENTHALRTFVMESIHTNSICYHIGSDLNEILRPDTGCSVITIPYRINKTPAGVLGILGPMRLPYRHLFSQITTAANHVSTVLTNSLCKNKITFRQPRSHTIYLKKEEHQLLDNKTSQKSEIKHKKRSK